MPVRLEDIFSGLCNHLNYKLRWSGTRRRFTDAVFSYFSQLAEKEECVTEERNYLTVDYVWHWKMPPFAHYQYIELAVEHENKGDVDKFLNEEIQHLIDVKADKKVAITYPQLGDEIRLIGGVKSRIHCCLRRFPLEKYLIILGFATRMNRKPAIRFHGYYLNAEGKEQKKESRILYQKS